MRQRWFRPLLDLPHGIPSHDAVGPVVRGAGPRALRAVPVALAAGHHSSTRATRHRPRGSGVARAHNTGIAPSTWYTRGHVMNPMATDGCSQGLVVALASRWSGQHTATLTGRMTTGDTLVSRRTRPQTRGQGPCIHRSRRFSPADPSSRGIADGDPTERRAAAGSPRDENRVHPEGFVSSVWRCVHDTILDAPLVAPCAPASRPIPPHGYSRDLLGRHMSADCADVACRVGHIERHERPAGGAREAGCEGLHRHNGCEGRGRPSRAGDCRSEGR